MTDKELRRLRRQDLLELLLVQGRETEQLKLKLETTQMELQMLKDNYEVLKQRLNDKDDTINHLKQRLNGKDERIALYRKAIVAERARRTVDGTEIGSIAEAAMKVNAVFEAAQKAADQYLYNVQRLAGALEAAQAEPEAEPLDILLQEDETTNIEEQA